MNDRRNNRMQVFSTAGVFNARSSWSDGPGCSGRRSPWASPPTPRSAPLYLADAGNGKVRIYDRGDAHEVGAFGRIGRYAGQFVFLHALAVDSRGDLYGRSRHRPARAEFVRR
ncbi:MAG: hypothetical protein R2708_09405 [Vicinamibacterales bacterium]